MALPKTIEDRNYQSFEENTDDQGVDRRVAVKGSVDSTGSILEGISFDAVDGTEASATVETYEYYSGGLAGTLVATVTITYTNASKSFVESVVRT